MRRHAQYCKHSQGGSALLIFALVLISALLGTFLSRLNSATQDTQRDQITGDAMAQAKDALIGFAVTYRDTHPTEVFGYLPCPDTDNDGISDSCGATDVSLIGRLPWKTLGLPPLRDGSTECLWYAVSGHAKDNPKTAAMNWDTLGQFVIQDVAGTILSGATAHDRPFAVILAPRSALNAQSRAPVGTSECGGSNTPADYLENIGALGTGNTTLVIANADSVRNGTNNDRALWITGKEIFDRVKMRSDFKTDIDSLVNDLTSYLNNLVPASLPLAPLGSNKGIDDTFINNYLATLTAQKKNVLKNWRDNLLYAGGPAGSFTVNGSSTICRAILFFGGERTTRTVAPLVAQTRATVTEKGDSSNFGDAAMYLEGTNASIFPINAAYTGVTQYDPANPGTNLLRCINGLGAGSASFDNPTDFASFVSTGNGVTTDATTTPTAPTVNVASAAGNNGGCVWFPNLMPLAGKTVRAYYEFKFSYGDNFALGDPVLDRGNGFTLQMVRNDIGFPTTCGTETNLGALGTSDMWGSLSFIIETDVFQNSSRNDPAGNHTAILANGSLAHAAGTMSSSCDGTLSGCTPSPANTFEESPPPPSPKQTGEIRAGGN